MSYTFEVDSPVESDQSDEALFVDYDEMFEDEDFVAMGIDPRDPTGAKPGSEDKVLMLAARYASGLPLWHDKDCYDHGPLAAMQAGETNEDED